MNKKKLVLTALVLTGVVASVLIALATANAAGKTEPGALPIVYGTAQLKSLKVVDGILLSSTTADLRASWFDSKVSCTITRSLKVKTEIYISPLSGNGKGRHVVRSGSFPNANCGEGGPGNGYTIAARGIHSACPSGVWKPAKYEFVVTATEPSKKLQAVADLSWRKGGSC